MLVDAGALRRTAGVDSALRLRNAGLRRSLAFAIRQRVADRQVVGAATANRVVTHVADGVRRARRVRRVSARVDAALRHAHTVLRAVGIDLALDLGALDERIALVAGRAFAGGAVIVAVALGADGARVAQNARVHTVAVVAHFVERAVLV